MFVFEVLADPLNKVVLKHSLDELVEQVRSDELVDISVGKVFCERLGGSFSVTDHTDLRRGLTVASSTIP